MSDIETILVSVLGSATGKKVWPLSVPANAIYPCIVYQQISGSQIRSHAGNTLQRPRFQISCWGQTYAEAVVLAGQVKTALDLNRVNFSLATKENELDDKEEEANLYRRILDFYIWV